MLGGGGREEGKEEREFEKSEIYCYSARLLEVFWQFSSS